MRETVLLVCAKLVAGGRITFVTGAGRITKFVRKIFVAAGGGGRRGGAVTMLEGAGRSVKLVPNQWSKFVAREKSKAFVWAAAPGWGLAVRAVFQNNHAKKAATKITSVHQKMAFDEDLDRFFPTRAITKPETAQVVCYEVNAFVIGGSRRAATALMSNGGRVFLLVPCDNPTRRSATSPTNSVRWHPL